MMKLSLKILFCMGLFLGTQSQAADHLPDQIHLPGITKKLFPIMSVDAQTIMGAHTLCEDELKDVKPFGLAPDCTFLQQTTIFLQSLQNRNTQPVTAATLFWYSDPEKAPGEQIYGQDIPQKWGKHGKYGRHHSIVAFAPTPKTEKVTEKSALVMLFNDGTVFKLRKSFKVLTTASLSCPIIISLDCRSNRVIHWPAKGGELKPGHHTIQADDEQITVISDGVKKIWSSATEFQEKPISDEETKEPIQYQSDELFLPDGSLYEQVLLPGKDHITLRKKLQPSLEQDAYDETEWSV